MLTQNFTNQIFHLFSTELCPKFDIQFSVEKLFGVLDFYLFFLSQFLLATYIFGFYNKMQLLLTIFKLQNVGKNNKYFSLFCLRSVFLPICIDEYFPIANSDFRSFTKLLTEESNNSSSLDQKFTYSVK